MPRDGSAQTACRLGAERSLVQIQSPRLNETPASERVWCARGSPVIRAVAPSESLPGAREGLRAIFAEIRFPLRRPGPFHRPHPMLALSTRSTWLRIAHSRRVVVRASALNEEE
jgi:hypothetical protein